MKNLLKKLLGKRIYVISPHFDDAVLSCGSLLLELSDKADITIINVFTKADIRPYTLSAKKLLKSCGYKNAIELYKKRTNEDARAFSNIKVEKVVNLGLVDALFRKKTKSSFLAKIVSEFGHQYPTYRLHVIGKVAKTDNSLQSLREKLSKIIPKNSIVFAPDGLSGHVDHQIVRTACESLFKKIIFYSEFPYNISKNNYGDDKNLNRLELKIDIKIKNRLILLYSSQIPSLFPKGEIPKHKEVYFLSKNI